MAGLAFTRAVSPKLADCALTHLTRTPIDAGTASLQHDAYEQALRGAGFEMIRLPDLVDYPDGVFVEDTALLINGHAIITRPGVASRAGEVESTASGLANHFEVHRIEAGHIDGGDVLRIGTTLYVGLSSRSDVDGVFELKQVAAKLGFEVETVNLRNCLHLKTAATLAGRDTAGRLVLLYNRHAVDPEQFAGVEALAVHEAEPSGANVARAGSQVIIPARNERTAGLLAERGFEVVEVDVSELEKAEAGVTCMSLISEGSKPGAPSR
jgi:dimethylargininase